MPFSQVDRIVELRPNESIVAEKTPRGDEDYLKDHFPNFPCIPGVLMLESMVQAGAWLLRVSDDFKRPVVMLKEAKNVKYGNFLAPGQTLHVTVEIKNTSESGVTKLKGQGTIDGKPAVSGILLLEQFELEDKLHTVTALDQVCRRNYREILEGIYQPVAVES